MSEGRQVRTQDIDGERLLLWVRDSKGGKDRAVPLPAATLKRLRNYWKEQRPPGEEFLRRFLQHVLPRRFHKVRYSGLLGLRNRTKLRQLQLLLATKETETTSDSGATHEQEATGELPSMPPHCQGTGHVNSID